jgi:predicted nucleic acid-binding protein
MLSDDKPKIYWDACVPLSYINASLRSHSPKSEQKQIKLDSAQEERIAKLWRIGSPIQVVEFYELIAQKARNLMRSAIPEGWSLKTGDAIHLATADHLKVTEFHTYDDKLDKYETITETHFKICRPLASQPVMVLGATQYLNRGRKPRWKLRRSRTLSRSLTFPCCFGK